MMPAGPLMVEHRLIEKVIELMRKEVARMKTESRIDADFIEKVVDFIRMYADRCHHGKEENILFRALAQKPLTADLKKTLQELVEEHVKARRYVRQLEEATAKYLQGDPTLLGEVIHHMETLAVFYPKHIEKEDKHFFLPCMEYFSQEEQDAMLHQFSSIDKPDIHEKYQKIYEDLAKR